MITLEYLIYCYNQEPQLVKKNGLRYYQLPDGITYPNIELSHKNVLKKTKGMQAAFFTAEEAEGAFLVNRKQEDIYFYAKDDLANPQSSFYRHNSFLIEKFKEVRLIELDEKEAKKELDYAEAPEDIKRLCSSKYRTKTYRINVKNDDFGIFTIIPAVDDIHMIIFTDLRSFKLNTIIHYLAINHLPINYIGLRNNWLPMAEESGVFPFHFGIIGDNELTDFVKEAKSDPYLSEILYLSKFSEINIQEKYVVTNDYKYFLPHTSVSPKLHPDFEVMAKYGYSYLCHHYEEESKCEQFFDFISYKEFINQFSNVPEYQVEAYKSELAKATEYGGKFFVYRVNGRIVSGAALEIVSREYIYLSYVFTIVQERGKGYLKKLLERIIQYANCNKKSIILKVINPLARKVYLDYGFKPIGHVLNDEYLKENH